MSDETNDRAAKAAPIVVHACSRALATSTEQNGKAGGYGAYPPTTDEREAVLEAFRVALYSDLSKDTRP
jgi:hypothetical protein